LAGQGTSPHRRDMAISDLSIINSAATRTGNDPVTAIRSDAGPVAAIALTNYEDSVKTELALYPWKRASKIVQLTRIDATVMGDPPEPWTAAYQLPDRPDRRSGPSSCRAIRSITRCTAPRCFVTPLRPMR
jgi:hypothetical protein